MERLKYLVGLNVLLGVWLLIAPFVMGYAGSSVELFNDVGLGVFFIACSWWILAAQPGQIPIGTLELLGGFWLIAAPYVLHYTGQSRAFTNDVIVGCLSVLVSATATWMLNTRLKKAV
ncbi:MAG: hypothetical protein C5B57_01190 [Blastocatellia bacterium]|nr:MAG: hypothetical protein C5B57_01190 [Blastocatellia bacterium]